jgi:hypothetical protein
MMTQISERLVVHCPDHEASHYVAAFVAEHRAGDGTVRIALRLPISVQPYHAIQEKIEVTS